jgi:CheY-like chemotaxis protein
MGQNASKTGPREGELAFRVVRYDGQEVPGELVMQRACRTGEPVLNDSYRIVHPDGMAAIVYGLVTQVGGTVRLESAPGVGTTATVLLPLIPVEELDREVVAEPVGRTGSGRRVLVVEDDPTVRRLAVDTLEHQGFVVESAGDGRDAIALLEARHPGVPVLYLSRYPGEAIERRGWLDERRAVSTETVQPPRAGAPESRAAGPIVRRQVLSRTSAATRAYSSMTKAHSRARRRLERSRLVSQSGHRNTCSWMEMPQQGQLTVMDASQVTIGRGTKKGGCYKSGETAPGDQASRRGGSAAANSAMLLKRSAARLASARRMVASSPCGTSGTRWRADGTGDWRMRDATSVSPRPL